MKLVSVAVPVPLAKPFDYMVPTLPEDTPLSSGVRVLVPFGSKTLVGVCLESPRTVEEADNEKYKYLKKVLDRVPSVDAHQMQLAKWLSDYYLHPIGEVLNSILPVRLRKNVELTEYQQEMLSAENAEQAEIDKLSASPKQAKLFTLLQQSALPLAQIKASFSDAVIKNLKEKHLITAWQKEAARINWQQKILLDKKHHANVEQSLAISSINESSGFNCFLLEGVTGSGKTEVYLQVIEEVILHGGQVLILVPEIGLTPQTVARFEKRFGPVVASIHSGLTDVQRLSVWHQARRGDVGIVIGTRSSVLLPMHRLAMIIVDEEHDESFKQQDGLRYHARDLAVYRAKISNIPLIMGSATPSLESLQNALSKKYRHLHLHQRAGHASMPTQHLLNISGVSLQAGLAEGLINKIETQLAQGNQVLLFVNRRGFAPSLLCHHCGHVVTCAGCDYPYTVHRTANNLQCHRCGEHKAMRYKCASCGSSDLSTDGLGTEQLEAFLTQRFPEYSCVRIDSDSTRSKQRLAEMLDKINKNKHQILIGTQILSKGHHFPNVTLAIVVNIDTLLFSADFRAPEKMGQLITQLSGRAGRANKPGEVWLQTHQPQHPLLQDMVQNGYGDFARTMLQERKSANLPPFSFQVLLRAEHLDQEKVLTFLDYAVAMLGQFKQAKIIGPLPCLIEKKQGRFRFQVVVQSQSRQYILSCMQQVMRELQGHKLSSRIRWHLDMQPQDFS
ncbi:primosomal protein N' [Glaciecola sp. 1036]|uniref:primosomal protein N' n=1 Tax=Alteromonadaceae TaxID=72275 RepID=UPI003CFC2AB7